ncbi:MAG: response regulator transcription factor [Blastochloris viridis]|uniref:Response regulator transcription factor n=1 Tax=Blastochloris viridis TaxID=1079 RepID=A0A6N4RBW2_BLAVI|nr:MAG: response regulator transcription factor [Blastochloris viridis]
MFRILLIEDDLPAQTELAEALRALDIQVDTAANPREIEAHLKTCETRPYHVVLTDYWLNWNSHSVSGDYTYREIRLSCGNTLPIIAASSDMPMWENLKAKKNDPHLHLIAKIPRGHGSFWNADATILLLRKLLPL